MVALGGWLLVAVGTSILLLNIPGLVEHYSYHKELLDQLRVGQTTAQDVRRLLGEPEYSFREYANLESSRTVLRYSVPNSGITPMYLYIDSKQRLARVDLAYTDNLEITWHLAIFSGMVIAGTCLLLLTGHGGRDERQAIALWLLLAVTSLFYVGSGVLLSASSHASLGAVLFFAVVVGWFVAFIKSLRQVTAGGRRPDPPPVVEANG